MTTQPWTESMDGTMSVIYFDEFGGHTQHSYQETRVDSVGGFLVFQHGPVAEACNNGTTIEAVIDALTNRLNGFQQGPFSNTYNAEAISHLQAAKSALERRTADRQKRGVEGLNRA